MCTPVLFLLPPLYIFSYIERAQRRDFFFLPTNLHIHQAMRSPSRSPKSPISSGKMASPRPKTNPNPNPKPIIPPPEPSWLDESSIHEMDHFARTLSGIKSKGIRPDHLASVLSHYASNWLPELSSSASARFSDTSISNNNNTSAPESPTATWLKKRFYVEALVAALPPEKEGGVAVDFLLRLLRTGSMVGAEPKCLRELEARAGRMLDGATLGEVMIPGFSHTCGTLLDVGLALRLVRRFFFAEQEQERGGGGAAAAKVARLVDAYLAEAAVDAALGIAEFDELARAVPAHARATDDGIYRAVDTYIKAHPNSSKQERKTLCRLIDARKLTAEASLHAIQNDRLPVRSVIQVVFSEHTKLNRLTDWSGSFTGARSPNPAQLDHLSAPRCSSKRLDPLTNHQELRRLRDDVARLQVQCNALQAQVDRLNSEKRRRGGLFRWSSFLFGGADVVKVEDSETGAERRTPVVGGKKGRAASANGTATPPKWRNSLS